MTRLSWSRRRFLAAAAMGATMSAAFPAPAQLLPRIGLIGLGVRGRQLLESCPAMLLAVCDVDRARLEALGERKLFATQDYRELLQRRDLDAVMIATPNHGHAAQAIDAVRLGKRVYVEAPAAFTLHEARTLEKAARQFGRDVHVGGLGAGPAGQLAARLTDWLAGAGAVRVTMDAPPNPRGGDAAKTAEPPPGFDWQAWLRPAARRPYHPDYAHLQWRWMQDYGGGMIRQHAPALLAAVLRSTRASTLTRATAAADGTPSGPGLWDCPREMTGDWELDGIPVAIAWRQRETTTGVRMTVEADGHTCTIEKTTGGYAADFSDLGTTTFDGNLRSELSQWLESNPIGTVDFSYALRAAELVELAALSEAVGRPVQYDFEQGRVLDDPYANRRMRRHAS